MCGIGRVLPDSFSVCPVCIVHLFCYRKKHKQFGLGRVREGRRSFVNSVKMVVVVSRSIHRHYFNIFRDILQENAKWTGAISYVALH